MAERIKRLEKGIESLKEEIEKHFEKLENDLYRKDFDSGKYHANEIEKSLLKALEDKLMILGIFDDSVITYRERLDELMKKIEES